MWGMEAEEEETDGVGPGLQEDQSGCLGGRCWKLRQGILGGFWWHNLGWRSQVGKPQGGGGEAARGPLHHESGHY